MRACTIGKVGRRFRSVLVVRRMLWEYKGENGKRFSGTAEIGRRIEIKVKLKLFVLRVNNGDYNWYKSR